MTTQNPTYTAISKLGHFVAFWKNPDGKITIFHPSVNNEQYYLFPQPPFFEYDDNSPDSDVINTAINVLFLQHSFPIDRNEISISKMAPGIYHSRIWRGISGYNPVSPKQEYGDKHFQSIVAASSLFSYLIEIFRHIEPRKENYPAFGHKIRELLILTCTEIESGWRTVLQENTKREQWKDIYNTTDYIKVKEPLRLDKWCVVLKDYPNLGEFTPFNNWSHLATTQSLSWYDTYNAVKHNRENKFSRATLESLLNAMAALHIMQVTQWGVEVYNPLNDNRFSPFEVTKYPEFVANELYIPNKSGFTAGLYFNNAATEDSKTICITLRGSKAEILDLKQSLAKLGIKPESLDIESKGKTTTMNLEAKMKIREEDWNWLNLAWEKINKLHIEETSN